MNIKFKQIEWTGDDPYAILVSTTYLFGYEFNIGFRIMHCADNVLRLIDFQCDHDTPNHKTQIYSVEEGKRIAQQRFEEYCAAIIKNMTEQENTL